jgi:gamma-glutamyltranspeptidase / glutathione hydrolase
MRRAWLAGLLIAVGLSCRGPAPAPPVQSDVAAGAAAPAPSEAPVLADGTSATFTRFAVVADHPQASQAGAEVLGAGGNAADAAVATMLALGVASPASSGLGGGGFALYYDAASGEATFVDFRETAPSAATPDMFQVAAEGPGGDEAGTPEPTVGLSAGVPGEPRGLVHLLERFGSLARADVAAPAIGLAEEGFSPGPRVAALMARFPDALEADPVGRAWREQAGGVPGPDTRLTNPALADTLRTFVARGDAPFYEGDIARDLVAVVRGEGGRLAEDDLTAYEVHERAPLVGDHLGHRWVTVPPESAGGLTLLTGLGLLERWHPAEGDAPWTDVDLLHAFAEAMRAPFFDRRRYVGDPRFVHVPVEALLAPDRLDRLAGVFALDEARPPEAYDQPLAEGQEGAAGAPDDRGTSHLCVVDAQGNVASVTTTINWPFGIRRSTHGFFINNELDDFTKKAGGEDAAAAPLDEPNLAHPGRRPVSSMTPLIVLDGAGRPVLCAGGSGGTRIVSSVLQVAYRAVVDGQAPGAAIAVPRLHASAEPGVHVEDTMPDGWVRALEGRGHVTGPMIYGASVQAVRIVRPDPAVDTGERLLQAASDPRKGGRPAGR